MSLFFDLEVSSTGTLNAKCYREHIYASASSFDELKDKIDFELDKAFQNRPKPSPSEIHFLYQKNR